MRQVPSEARDQNHTALLGPAVVAAWQAHVARQDAELEAHYAAAQS